MKIFSFLYHYRGVITLISAFFCAILCLLPVFLLNVLPEISESDVQYARFPSGLMNVQTSLTASFFIIIVPFVDIVFDIPHNIMVALSSKKKIQTVSVMRLTDIERLLIIMGMGIQSTTSFVSRHDMNMSQLGLVYSCTNYCSEILVLTPVLVYLNRMSKSFTYAVLCSILFFFLIGQLLLSFSFFIRYNNDAYDKVYLISKICVIAAVVLTFYASTKSFIKFVYLKVGTKNARRVTSEWFQYLRSVTYPEWQQSMNNNPEIYSTYIPAFHLIASLVIIAGNLYAGTLLADANPDLYDYKNYAVILAETLILVMEFRIRKNEMEKGLVSKTIRNLSLLILDSYNFYMMNSNVFINHVSCLFIFHTILMMTQFNILIDCFTRVEEDLRPLHQSCKS
jgi:hypothetical protein